VQQNKKKTDICLRHSV